MFLFPQPLPQDFHRVVKFLTKMWENGRGEGIKTMHVDSVFDIDIVFVFDVVFVIVIVLASDAIQTIHLHYEALGE